MSTGAALPEELCRLAGECRLVDRTPLVSFHLGDMAASETQTGETLEAVLFDSERIDRNNW